MNKKKNLSKINYAIIIIMFIFITINLSIFVIYLNIESNKPHKPFVDKPLKNLGYNLNIDGLNESEKDIVKRVIEDLNPLYLQSQGNITFLKNITNNYKNDGGVEDDVIGYYDRSNGNIFIEYTPYTEYMKMIICHELLHHFTYTGNYTHEIVYDLGYKKVCFKYGRT